MALLSERHYTGELGEMQSRQNESGANVQDVGRFGKSPDILSPTPAASPGRDPWACDQPTTFPGGA